jgi:apolipoprotein N-acyltransferase
MNRLRIFLCLLALTSGAILPFAFAPYGYYLAAEISLILLLVTWSKASPKQAFWYGWLFGVAFFSFGIYWVYISIHDYGHAPAILALTIISLLISFLALFPAVQGYLMQKVGPKNNWQKYLAAFPISLVVFEWVRGWILSGFPWLFLGYGHIDSPLRGYAPILSVYGVSFFIALTSGTIFYLFYERPGKKTIVLLGLFITIVWYGGGQLAKVNWTKQIDKELTVSLIQGNILQERKWNPKEFANILNLHVHLTSNNLTSDIIIWPESAIPVNPKRAGSFLKPLSAKAEEHNTAIFSGAPIYDDENGEVYNGIIALGSGTGQYHKRRLVPFGEFMPFKYILIWLRDFVEIPMSDFSWGAKKQPGLHAGKILIAPFVCYEIAYGDLVLDYMPKAKLLLTVSDDSWFGDSIAPYQHLEIARMRSLEVGRYQLVSTNTGISAIIDDKGKVVAKTPVFKETVLTAKVKTFTGSTPWVFLHSKK